MKNRHGFTLIELLATITVLGIIMLVAVPNVVGIVKKNKDRTYIEDAKKLATLAEYKYRSDSTITKPNVGSCIVMRMSYLGANEFETAPNGGTYNVNNSFVVIKIESNVYNYYVALVEDVPKGSSRGVKYTNASKLTEDNAINSYVASGANLGSKSASSMGCIKVY